MWQVLKTLGEGAGVLSIFCLIGGSMLAALNDGISNSIIRFCTYASRVLWILVLLYIFGRIFQLAVVS